MQDKRLTAVLGKRSQEKGFLRVGVEHIGLERPLRQTFAQA